MPVTRLAQPADAEALSAVLAEAVAGYWGCDGVDGRGGRRSEAARAALAPYGDMGYTYVETWVL